MYRCLCTSTPPMYHTHYPCTSVCVCVCVSIYQLPVCRSIMSMQCEFLRSFFLLIYLYLSYKSRPIFYQPSYSLLLFKEYVIKTNEVVDDRQSTTRKQNKKIWFAIDYNGKQPSFWRYYSHQVRVYRHICILSLQWLHDFHSYSTHAYLMLPSYILYSSMWEKWYGSHSWVLHWLTTLLHSSFDHLPSFVVQISQSWPRPPNVWQLAESPTKCIKC